MMIKLIHKVSVLAVLTISLVTMVGCGGSSNGALDNTVSSSSSSSSSSSQPAEAVSVTRIRWGLLDDQFGDLYLPLASGGQRLPVVIMIHGGCWQLPYGLEYQDALSEAMARRGLAVWNIEYRRLGGGGEWPNLLQDVARAADYIAELAMSQPIDTQRAVSVGHSAGGHLALWLAGRHKIAPASELYDENPLALRGAISLAGVADLTSGACGSAARTLVDADALSTTALGQRLTNTSPNQMLPLAVPTLLIAGTQDTIVPPRIAQAYVDAAILRGDMSEVMVIAGADHFDLIDPDVIDITLLTDTAHAMTAVP